MRTALRPAETDDAPAIRSVYAPYVENTPISFEVDPPSVAELAERVESTLREYPWLVCEVGDEVIGYAAAGSLRSTPPYEWTVELTVYVDESARRSGVGTALYSALLSVLERQGYYNAYAAVTLPNPASAALHERMGFEPVGTFPALGFKGGEWHDVRWWYRRLADPPSDPDPPTPFPDVRDDPGVERALESAAEHVDA